MQGATAALVTGVHGVEEIRDLGSPDLTHHQPVGSHPQGLPDQHAHRNLTSALHVGRTRLQTDDVWVVGAQLAPVLHDHQPVAGVDETEQRGQQSGLSRPGAATDQEGETCLHDTSQQRGASGMDRAGDHQLLQRERPTPGDAQRDRRSRPGQWSQDGMEPGAVGQTQVNVGRGVIEPSATEASESLGETSYGVVVGEAHLGQLKTMATVEIHGIGAVDQHVGDTLHSQ